MTPSAILDVIKSAPLSVTYFGLRVEDGRTFAVGEFLPNSRVWDDGEPTDDEVDGTCAIDLGDEPSIDDIVTAIEQAQSYNGSTLVLIAGKYRGYGQDDGEAVIKQARCLAIWQR